MTSLLSTATVLALITGVVIPAVSALVTPARLPRELVGVVTLVLSAVSGFASQWAASSDVNHYDWRAAALTSLGALATAVLGYLAAFKGKPTARLHQSGVQ